MMNLCRCSKCGYVSENCKDYDNHFEFCKVLRDITGLSNKR